MCRLVDSDRCGFSTQAVIVHNNVSVFGSEPFCNVIREAWLYSECLHKYTGLHTVAFSICGNK